MLTDSKHMAELEKAVIEFKIGNDSQTPKRMTVIVDLTGIRFDMTNCSFDPSFWLTYADFMAVARIASELRNGRQTQE
jgi:hypothetical protein